jgi:tritrans,polycis-undecaprenyl-diphosphate synthase [geranylgeranyl-diphosphate specific]
MNQISKVPKHIGIILDGNRRFSKKLMLKPWKGHEFGAKKVEKLLDWSKEFNVRELTLYAFSIENFDRPKQEFDYLMELFRKEFDRLIDDKRVMADKLRLNFIGRIWMFPKDIQEKMNDLMKKTKNNDGFFLNFAMAYGGRAEIIDATKKIAEKVKEGKLDIKDINEELFNKNIYLESEPDLIIRTGGEQRLSGFLLWQGSYAEIFWVDHLWPEFSKEDFVKSLESYSERDRRFGK